MVETSVYRGWRKNFSSGKIKNYTEYAQEQFGEILPALFAMQLQLRLKMVYYGHETIRSKFLDRSTGNHEYTACRAHVAQQCGFLARLQAHHADLHGSGRRNALSDGHPGPVS